MKKWVIIGGTVLVLAAAAAIPLALAKDTRTVHIKDYLAGNTELTETEKELLDMDGNGTINQADLLRAKFAALNPNAAKTEIYSADQAMPLGRTAYHEETKTLWCSLSGTGVSFRFFGNECRVTLTADSMYTSGEAGAVRYGVYVNDTLMEDAQLTEETHTLTITNPGEESAETDVRIVKLSESAQSSFGIRDIAVSASGKFYKSHDGDLLIPNQPKARLIEFIGDSITCGYGVDGEFNKDTFKTANENVTKAYGYLTAQQLDADYSMVSYSGHGIISGYSGNGEAVTNQLVPRFYDQVGHCSAVVEGKHKIQDDKWDFAVQPDLIVINLGTNDASYTGNDTAKQREYAAEYTEFLKTVREKNPDAPILCTLGIMGQTLCDAIDLAVLDYQKETGDQNINVMRFDMQSGDDGYAVDWHPSAATHQKAANQLSAFVRDWLGW